MKRILYRSVQLGDGKHQIDPTNEARGAVDFNVPQFGQLTPATVAIIWGSYLFLPTMQ